MLTAQGKDIAFCSPLIASNIRFADLLLRLSKHDGLNGAIIGPTGGMYLRVPAYVEGSTPSHKMTPRPKSPNLTASSAVFDLLARNTYPRLVFNEASPEWGIPFPGLLSLCRIDGLSFFMFGAFVICKKDVASIMTVNHRGCQLIDNIAFRDDQSSPKAGLYMSFGPKNGSLGFEGKNQKQIEHFISFN